MTRLIKKYKNRRLYDTEISRYITLEQLHSYVVENKVFKVEDAESGADLTNTVLLQIIVEMEAGANPFLSETLLRQIICFANHPMSRSCKTMMEQVFQLMEHSPGDVPYQQMNTWTHDLMQQWQKLMQGR